MDSPAPKDAIKRLLAQCDTMGLNDPTARAQSIALALRQIGVHAALVKRSIHHHYMGIDCTEKIGTRSFRFQETPYPLVQLGVHLIDPVVGITSSTDVLESTHLEAFSRLAQEDMCLATTWWKDWGVLDASPNVGAKLGIDDADQDVWSKAATLNPSQEWEARINALIARAVPSGGRTHVGSCLALMAGVAAHLSVHELLPAQTHRILTVKKLGERSLLGQRGVQLSTQAIGNPLFHTMDLPAGGTERRVSWLPSYDPRGSKLIEGIGHIQGEEGTAQIPMSSTQRWHLEQQQSDNVEAFMELTKLLAQRHRQLCLTPDAPTRARVRM